MKLLKKNRGLNGFLGKKLRNWQNKKSRRTPLQQTRPPAEDSGWGQGHDLTQSCSKCGPLTSSCISWELVRNVNSWVLPQIAKSESLGITKVEEVLI